MKKIFLLLLLLTGCDFCCGAIFGVSAEYVKQKTTEIKTSFDSEINGIKGDISGVKNTMRDLNMTIGAINTDLQAKITGLDQSVSTKITAGRDALSNSGNTNDTRLMIIIIKSLCGLCTLLIGLISFTVKAMFREMSNARYYQTTLAKVSEKEDFDKIMIEKKELNKQKTILGKIVKVKDILVNGGKK